MTSLHVYNPDLPENVVDFTVYKLQKCIEVYIEQGSPNGAAFEQALALYLQQKLAIEWDGGQPFAIVTDATSAKTLQDQGAVNKAEFLRRPEDQQTDEMTGIDEKDENEKPNDSE
tara:strand:+ start:860 stop:1204 length:345 start_codon:yes stop_codon:yes gene_type:complete